MSLTSTKNQIVSFYLHSCYRVVDIRIELRLLLVRQAEIPGDYVRVESSDRSAFELLRVDDLPYVRNDRNKIFALAVIFERFHANSCKNTESLNCVRPCGWKVND